MWQSKRKGNSLPSRSDFDFLDFKGWWGKIAIVKFENNPFNVKFTLWGTDLTEWWGTDYTNKYLGENALSPEAWQSIEGRYFQEMVSSPFIGLVKGQLDQHERPHRRVIGVDLPLADRNQVTQCFLAHLEIDEETDLKSLFPNNPVVSYF
ncbi:PAS domain-containing protein [Sneathiella sp. P13V-1]|nr:PAS domain-containing protein [Sneathiella sp. P13V-1]